MTVRVSDEQDPKKAPVSLSLSDMARAADMEDGVCFISPGWDNPYIQCLKCVKGKACSCYPTPEEEKENSIFTLPRVCACK